MLCFVDKSNGWEHPPCCFLLTNQMAGSTLHVVFVDKSNGGEHPHCFFFDKSKGGEHPPYYFSKKI